MEWMGNPRACLLCPLRPTSWRSATAPRDCPERLMAGVTKTAFIEELAIHVRGSFSGQLHSQAIALHERTGRGLLTFIARDGQRPTWDETNRVVFLLGGQARLGTFLTSNIEAVSYRSASISLLSPSVLTTLAFARAVLFRSNSPRTRRPVPIVTNAGLSTSWSLNR
jgi:hypothetical protein